MSTITIRLPNELLEETDKQAHELHIARAEYIRTALERMNSTMREEAQRERLKKASLKVREESMRINKEFSESEDDELD